MTASVSDLQAIYPTPTPQPVLLGVAQRFVDSQLLNKGLDSGVYDDVVLYVAAHLCVLSLEQGGLRRQRIGDADESFKTPGDFDLGLRQTRFGQMAMILDSTGTLAAAGANSGLKALFEVV